MEHEANKIDYLYKVPLWKNFLKAKHSEKQRCWAYTCTYPVNVCFGHANYKIKSEGTLFIFFTRTCFSSDFNYLILRYFCAKNDVLSLDNFKNTNGSIIVVLFKSKYTVLT